MVGRLVVKGIVVFILGSLIRVILVVLVTLNGLLGWQVKGPTIALYATLLVPRS